jgi:hypothetical protein
MSYEETIRLELQLWKLKMSKEPSMINAFSKKMQTKINSYIPEKVHNAITTAIREMTRGILFGAGVTNAKPIPDGISLQVREHLVRERITFYRNTAAAEGALTGAGGILLGLADFPIWLTLKMKMLFEVGALYGADLADLKERVYLLHIFQLTFSSQKNRNDIFYKMDHWAEESANLPSEIKDFDWRNFQQEYRDYIDIAKLLQLVPGIGAVVGGVVNHRLTEKLGNTAINAYRLRWPLDSAVKLLNVTH